MEIAVPGREGGLAGPPEVPPSPADVIAKYGYKKTYRVENTSPVRKNEASKIK